MTLQPNKVTTNAAASAQVSQDFIAFALEKEVLRFGEFKTKAGRLSPYFFNAGLFNDGVSLMKLGELSAVQEVIANNQIPVCAIANLSDLMRYLADHQALADHLQAVSAYRQQFGVN